MEKVNRLVWTDGLLVRAHGTLIGIRSNTHGILDQVREKCLLPTWRVRQSGRELAQHLYSLRVAPPARLKGSQNYHLLYSGGGRIARSLDLEETLEILRQDVAELSGQLSQQELFLRAGVVCYRGGAIVLPGPPGAGTSTLIEALVNRGAVYSSDRFAVLDRQGKVVSYPEPCGPRLIPAHCLGWKPRQRRLPVQAVLFTHYEAGRAAGQFEPLSRGQAVLRLFGASLSALRQPNRDLSRLTEMVAGAALLAGPRGSADEAAGTLLHQIQTRTETSL